MAEWHYCKNGQQLGPVSSETLRQMLNQGQLDASDLVWRDGMAQWVKASQVNGLFEAASAAPPALAATAATLPSAAVAVVPVPAQPIEYATPRGIGLSAAWPLPAKTGRGALIAFSCVTALMLVINAMLLYMTISARSSYAPMQEMQEVMWAMSTTCGFMLLGIAALVLWLVMVSGVHGFLRALSGGQYDISPGKAVGFSFIPVFDGFWIIYMPWRACEELNRHLALRGLAPVSAGMVMACQIGSVVTALFLPGLTPALYAASMWQIQAGMNRILQVQAT